MSLSLRLLAGVCGAAFFYRAAYEGGAAYLLIPPPGLGPAPADPQQAAKVITSFISEHSVSHRDAVRHFARYLAFTIEEEGMSLTASSSS